MITILRDGLDAWSVWLCGGESGSGSFLIGKAPSKHVAIADALATLDNARGDLKDIAKKDEPTWTDK